MTDPLVDFKSLFESVPGLYLVLLPDFTIVAVSDAYLQATMTNRQEIVGRNLFDVFPDNPDDQAATGETNLRLSLQYVLQHKVSHTMAVQKYDIRNPDGVFEERYWSPLNKPVMDADQRVKLIIHRVEDVTDMIRMRKEESEKLKASEKLKDIVTAHEVELYLRAQEIQKINIALIKEISEREIAEKEAIATRVMLQSTIESHHDLLIFLIDTEFRFLFFNTAFKTSTYQAYGTTVVEGMSMLDCITVEQDREKAKINCQRALNGESHLTVQEYGDQKKIYFETRYTPVRNERKEITGVTVQSANITERVQAEEQIKSLNSDLESFTYSVAHDLRAPLRAIDGYASVLRESTDQVLNDESIRLLMAITQNARKMGKLIDDLLSFSRMGKIPLKINAVDVQLLLKGVLDEQSDIMNKAGVQIDIGTLEPLQCDASLMQHVFTNLLSNAVKYSRNRQQPHIQVGSNRNSSEVTYFIRDNGVGFDMKFSNKLFGVFQRLHSVADFEGTGVGLAIVHRIITKHGGRVWAEGEVGKGATFYFSLPVKS
jgi:PAS domain S-box-containing protein